MAEEIEELEEIEEKETATEPEELSTFDLDPAEQVPLNVQNIAIEDIAELPNIRPAYHGIEGLAETIYVEGQLQPCLVRPTPEGAEHDKPYELIFGYRRKRAIEHLNSQEEIEGDFSTIRCEVREVKDDKDLSQMIVENMQREELSPVAEARAMLALKDSSEPPLSNAEIARRLGCDPSHVSHRLKMVTKLAIPPAPVEEESEEEEPQGISPTLTVSDVSVEESPMKQIKETDGEETEDPEDEEAPKKKQVDILELVDSGKISASGAEVIASLDDRDDQEKLAQLMVRQDWGVKQASKWARKVKEQTLDEGSEEMGDIEMVTFEEIVELPKLSLKEDVSKEEFAKINLYALLRNGMDQEILNYLETEMNVPFEALWDYVNNLSDKDVLLLTERYLHRYITAAHRYHSLEPSLIDQLSDPSGLEDPEVADMLPEFEAANYEEIEYE